MEDHYGINERKIDVLQSSVSQTRLLGCFDSQAPVPGANQGHVFSDTRMSCLDEVLMLETTHMWCACWRPTTLLGPTQRTHSDQYLVTCTHLDGVSCCTILLSRYQGGIQTI